MADGNSSIVPMHTILEVYRVSDLALECVLPSAADEVNAACFHPIEASLFNVGSMYPVPSDPKER